MDYLILFFVALIARVFGGLIYDEIKKINKDYRDRKGKKKHQDSEDEDTRLDLKNLKDHAEEEESTENSLIDNSVNSEEIESKND